MNLLRQFPFLSFLLVLTAIAAFCLTSGGVELLVVAGVLAGLSWYVTEGPRGRTLPAFVSNLLVLAATVSMVVDATQRVSDLPAVLGRFAVWLILIKLYDRRTARDHGQLMSLSLLLMLIGCAKPPSLLFGILLLIYVIVGLYCLLLYQLYFSHERTQADRRHLLDDEALSLRPRIGRRVGLHLRTLAAGVGISGLVMSVVIFILFPRDLGEGMMRMESSRDGVVTGELTDSISLGEGSRITTSSRRVGTVEITGPGGLSVGAGQSHLMRGAVYTRYQSGEWKRPSVQGRFRSARTGQTGRYRRVETLPGIASPLYDGPLANGGGTRGVLQQTVRLLFPSNDVYALATPVRISTPEVPASVVFDGLTHAMSINVTGRRGARAYIVESIQNAPAELRAQVSGSAINPRNSSGLSPVLVSDSAGDPGSQIRVIARRILDDAGIDRVPPREVAASRVWRRNAATAFARHLEGGEFRYTLDLSDVFFGTTDPVVHFLTVSKRGHCEYFAAAHAALCQSVSIPARVVGGFSVHEYDPAVGRFVIRAGDAHAWTEVQTDAAVWETFDPTPPGVNEPEIAGSGSLAGRLNRFYEELEGSWTDSFVGFDGGDTVATSGSNRPGTIEDAAPVVGRIG